MDQFNKTRVLNRMRKGIVSGVYPTMVTPFKEDLAIDYTALERLISWYTDKGIDGLFSVCQSSAMFELSRRERKELCRKTVELAGGRFPVMASGHISDTISDQVDELMDMAEAGADALVLVSNRLASPDQNDATWLKSLETLLAALPDTIPLGVYECPYPYKRLLSEEIILALIATNRFQFIKDTCCNPSLIAKRAALVKGTNVKFFNANAATLLYSLRQGYAGYSGVMANFHPELYRKLCHNWESMGKSAEELQNYLGTASIIEYQSYPANAKYAFMKEGIFPTAICRHADTRYALLHDSQIFEINQFRALSADMCAKFLSEKGAQ